MTDRPNRPEHGEIVVVGVDGGEESLEAIRWAVAEARARHAAAVHLLYAIEAPPVAEWIGMPDDFAIRMLEYARQSLDAARVEAEKAADGLPVEDLLCTGSPAGLLTELSERVGLVVVGSRPLSRWGAIIGSVSGAVAARARCPVVVVRWRPAASSRTPALGRAGLVVVGVDGSRHANPALDFAFAYAHRHGVRLQAVLALDPVPFDYDVTAGTFDPAGRMRERLDERLRPWRRRYPTVRVETWLPIERPVDALVAGSADAELLVVGATGRHKVVDTLLGSVSQGVLQHAHCPVAVVHES